MSARWTAEEYQTYQARQQGTGKEKAPDEPEARLLSKVLALAKQHGWLTYHTHRSDRSEKGFPDLVLCRESIIFAELKTSTGKLTMEQTVWLERLKKTGQVEVRLWRPADWPAIEARLTRRTHED